MLYTDKIREVLEHQERERGPRLFKVEYYRLHRHTQSERMVWGIELHGFVDDAAEIAAQLSARITVALMKGNFTTEDVFAFIDDLRVEKWGPGAGRILCWPDYPNSFDARIEALLEKKDGR